MLALVINGYYQSSSSTHQLDRLRAECEKQCIDYKVVQQNAPNKLYEQPDFDTAIYLDKDISYAKMLEKNGVKVLNSAESIAICDNKTRTLIALNDVVKIPKTAFSPKIYNGYLQGDYITRLESIFDYPIVIKESYGSLGAQVYMATDRESLSTILIQLGTKEHLYQELISSSIGRSIRVYVVNGKVMGGIRLVNDKDFRSNAAFGGRSSVVNLSYSHKSSALQIANALSLDFCGIDFFDTAEPLLIEVNSNAYFVEMEKYGINIAAAMIEQAIVKE